MSTLPTNPNHPFPQTTDDRRETTNDFPRLASDPPHLHPTKLFQLLEQGIVNYADLQAQLNCSAADLRESLASPDAHELLELQSALTATQLRILALKAAPAALQNLIDLQKESQSPLVRCRASEKILATAGTPTLVSKAEPAQPLLEPSEEEEEPDEEAIFQRVISVLPLSEKQKTQMEKVHHHPLYRRRYFTPEQDHLFNAALEGKRIPTPPLKSETSNFKSPDASPPQPPRAA